MERSRAEVLSERKAYQEWRESESQSVAYSEACVRSATRRKESMANARQMDKNRAQARKQNAQRTVERVVEVSESHKMRSRAETCVVSGSAHVCQPARVYGKAVRVEPRVMPDGDLTHGLRARPCEPFKPVEHVEVEPHAPKREEEPSWVFASRHVDG